MRDKTLSFFSILILAFFCSSSQTNKEVKLEHPGWKLSLQSYTFHLFSVMEALDKTKQLGLHYIEVYPGQQMGGDFGELHFGYQLSDEDQRKLKTIADLKEIKIVSSGVWTAKREEWDKIFSFAKSMEMEFISAEPAKNDWDLVEELAKRYQIKVAVHNHPSESSYWSPEILLQAIDGRSELIGASADVGHYGRMGLDPLECVKKLRGRIISFHFKDIAPVGSDRKLEDVVWGTGVLQVDEMLNEMKRQNFEGYFTIEYEANWENNLPDIEASIDYFNQVVDQIRDTK
jgi:sugar phosphate isomerase/epimerase